TVNGLADNPYAAASQALLDYLYQQHNAEQGQAAFLTSNNLALRRADFARGGGFDASYGLAGGEDRDFCRRWLAAGLRLAFEPAARVSHSRAMGLGGFLGQHFNYGRGAYRFHRGRPAGARRLAPLGFYARLLGYPLRRPAGHNRLGQAGLLALSQLATAAGYARQGLAGRDGTPA
ncbi:MAG: glycosyltransferase family 2 protein, partial [Candidatus Promineifilaceae bacterium]